MKAGWICLHRKLIDSLIWNSNEPFDKRSAWADLLMMANFCDTSMIFDGHNVVVKRGQILTSVRKLSERWRWNKDRTLRYLRLLEECGMIDRESNAKRTLITIVKYDDYQNVCDTDTDTKRDTHTDTDTDTDQDTDTPHNNNSNNSSNNSINKRGKIFSPPTLEEVKAYCQERNNTINPEAFIDYYASQKWKKANGRPVEDWKACVRTWEKREKDKPKPTNKFNNFEQRNYDMEELEKRFLGVM